MKLARLLAIGIACALAPATAVAGDATLVPYLRFDRVTGMTKGAVRAIVQDPTGFMWFGTDEGLSRYDGYEFINYTAGADPAKNLSAATVTSLAVTDTALYIGTSKGLDKLDLATSALTHQHANAKDPAALGSDDISSLSLGAKGSLWIGTSDAGVDRLDLATDKVEHFRADPKTPDTIPDDGVNVVRELKDGTVWIGTREAGLGILDPKTKKVKRYVHDANADTSLASDAIYAIYQDHDGTVWIGTGTSLDRFDPKTGTFAHYLQAAAPAGAATDAGAATTTANTITAIVDGRDGGLWLGVKGIGVARFDRKTFAIESYKHDGADPTSIGNPVQWVAFADRGGVLWFGGDAGGASKLDLLRRQFTYYRAVHALSFVEQGNLTWLGTQGSGIRSFDPKTGAVKAYLDTELKDTWTTKIVPAGDGTLWLATTDRGLFHFNPATGALETFDTENNTLPSDAVLAVIKDGNTLWIGTFGGGLVKFDTKAKTAERYTSLATNAATLSSDAITTLYQDPTKPNLLWVGTAEGLNAFDKQSLQVVRYRNDPAKPTSLSHDHVTDIHADAKGTLWIATWGGGIDRFDRAANTFTAVRTAQGLASDVVYGILEDKSGRLWLTTNGGLTRFDPAKNEAARFGATDGLQDDEFAQGGFYQGASGSFYVGGPNGFNVFDPETIKTDTYVPPIVVTRLEVLGEARPFNDTVSLSYRDRSLTLRFAALSYAAPARNRYKYRLVGLDDTWVETDQRYVNYTSIPSGSYKLEIQGSNGHGVWSEAGVTIAIKVAPPPWRTWWAYCLYAALVVLIGGLLYRRHRGQLDALRRSHRLSELEREVALTTAVQEGFFPVERSVRDNSLALEAFYRAAAQCGGDWWTYESRGDNYLMIVGDVTGHGIGSAMVVAAAAATFRSVGRSVDDDARLWAMNEEVLRVSRGQYHMTLTAVELDLRTGRYLIRSAGGVPVFSLAPGSRARVLMCPGTPLGSTDFELGRLEGQLAPGERLLILTDGVPEVALANQQILGPRGVADFYMKTRELELKTALEQLIAKVEEVSTSAQDDDWTVVLVQWGQAAERSNQRAA